jgi:hypothetical protein
MGVLQGAIDQALNGVLNLTTGQCWTLEAAKPKLAVGTFAVDPISRRAGIQNTAASQPYDWFLGAAMAIDELSYATTTYDNIIRQHLFRELYQCGTRSLPYIDGTALVPKLVDSVPCQICGLVIPLAYASIDHVRPQTGGGHEAVAKVLRILGMSVDGPRGTKTSQLQSGVTTASGHGGGLAAGLVAFQTSGKVQAVPTKTGRGPKAADSAQHLKDRYSLNWEGQVFYSLVRILGCLNELEVRCMHSLVNLRPLCNHCNSARGNPLKF